VDRQVADAVGARLDAAVRALRNQERLGRMKRPRRVFDVHGRGAVEDHQKHIHLVVAMVADRAPVLEHHQVHVNARGRARPNDAACAGHGSEIDGTERSFHARDARER
jgi:hypothetical protein